MGKKLNLTIFVLLLLSNFTIAETYKIAFGSCLDQEYPQTIWEAVNKENIDSFVFLGDNVYGDIPSGKLNKMVTAYELQSTTLGKLQTIMLLEGLVFVLTLMFMQGMLFLRIMTQ